MKLFRLILFLALLAPTVWGQQQFVKALDSIAALKQASVNDATGRNIYIYEVGLYRWDPSSTATADDDLVVESSRPGVVVGRWLKDNTIGGSAVEANLGIINVTDASFGAVTNAESTVAIQAAADFAATMRTAGVNGGRITLFFPPGLGYITTNTIEVLDGISVWQEAPILYAGDENEPALVIGAHGPGKDNYQLSHKLQARRQTLSDWSDEGSIGIQLINPLESYIDIVKADRFTIGVQILGSGSDGAVHNNINLRRVYDNKVGLDFASIDSGWVNENTVIGGRIGQSSSTGSGLERYGIRYGTAGGDPATGNKVFGTSFELFASTASPNDAVNFLFVNATDTYAYHIRSEGNSVQARSQNSSVRNEIIGGYMLLAEPTTVENEGDLLGATFTGSRANHAAKIPTRTVFNSGPLSKKANYYGGSSLVHIPGMSWQISSITAAATNGVTIQTDYIEITGNRALQVYMDTRHTKRFAVFREFDTTFGGRVAIRCYDDSGTVLTDADPGHPYVRGSQLLSYGTGYGGRYATVLDTITGPVLCEVTSDVAYVAVMIAKGTDNVRLKSFQISVPDGSSAAVWPGYEEGIPGVNLATTPPTAGTHSEGKILLNVDTAIPESPIGWRHSAGEFVPWGILDPDVIRDGLVVRSPRGALEGDGTTDAKLTGSDGVDLGTNDFSIAATIQLSDYTSGISQRLFSSHGSGGNNRLVVSVSALGGLQAAFVTGTGAESNYSVSISGDVDWVDGDLYHVVLSCDRDGNATAYLNGRADRNGDGTNMVKDISGVFDLDIGSGNANPWTALGGVGGKVYSLQVFDRALTATEALALYRTGVADAPILDLDIHNADLVTSLTVKDRAGTYDATAAVSGVTQILRQRIPTASNWVADGDTNSTLSGTATAHSFRSTGTGNFELEMEGTEDEFETVVTHEDATQDNTITFPDESGKVALQEWVVGSQTGTNSTPTVTTPLAPTWTGPMHTVWYGATGEIDLPAAAGYEGRALLIYNTGAFTITVDPNASEIIVRDGTAQTGGVSFTLDTGAGNYVSLLSDGERWITLGYKGTLAEGS